MLSRIARFFLMATSIAPIGFTYAFVAFTENKYFIAAIVLGICMMMPWCTIKFLQRAQWSLSTVNFKANSIESADSENIAFMVLYLLPLFENGFGGLNWAMTIPAIIVFGAVIWTGYGYHFNPLLGLLGWHFYKVGTDEGVTYILITKKQLRSAKQLVEVGQLTEFIILDKDEGT